MLFGYRTWRHVFYIYVGITLMGVIAFYIRSVKFSFLDDRLNWSITVVSIVLASVFWEALRLVDFWMERWLPFEKSIPKRVVIQLGAGVLLGIMIRFFIYRFGEPHVPIKLDEMFLATTWFIYAFLPTAINFGFFTVHFINRWKKSIIRAERLQREKSQVQFDNLKNQLNPHFLFNALTSLNSLIFQDQALASQFLQQLSKVYRYVLQNKDKTVVSLETEISFIEHYINLLKTRFGDSIMFTIDIPDAARDKAIVPVTLQILIENALKHNIVDQAKPLHLAIRVSEDYLVVSNNLQPRKLVETSNRQGLENLKTLYRFLSDRPLIHESENDIFSVKIPLV